MNFAEKLRTLRKEMGMSQEKLAEKLGVSRQAITKWETDAGIPDIENIKAISALFGISIDELLSNETAAKDAPDYLYESVVEYDIDELKHYDMKLGGAKRIVLSGYDGQKLLVRLVSNTIATLQNDFKVKIDDARGRIDVDLTRRNGITEAAAKEDVTVFVRLPAPYIRKAELAANAETVEVSSLECEDIELNIKASNVIFEDVAGSVELDCNLDMNIICRTLNGKVAVNQLSATSKICIPEGTDFTAVTNGVGTSISYEKNGERTEAFDRAGAANIIELNGLKSELIINQIAF